MRVVFAGNPNVGKTSLFNHLTGSRYRVGNYSGVTVEKREGALKGQPSILLCDLPGTYSLTPVAQDEQVAYREILGLGDAAGGPDLILVVIDASNLARNLYFVHQVAELGRPFAVALNMVDSAQKSGRMADLGKLQAKLGVPVVPTCGHSGEGVDKLAQLLASPKSWQAQGPDVWGKTPLKVQDPSYQRCLQALSPSHAPPPGSSTHSWICASAAMVETVQGGQDPSFDAAMNKLQPLPAELKSKAAAAVVKARYAQVDRLLEELFPQSSSAGAPDPSSVPTPPSATERLDRVFTHKLLGPALFLCVMLLVFQAMFSGADPLMGAIEDLVSWLQELVQAALGPGMLTDLLTQGVLAGVGNVVVFIPQIALLFLGIGLLEDCGYMARAAFLADKAMSKVGLNGRSFLPLLSGYACAIPAIMGTRSLTHWRERLVTMLMIPYTSCSARLPIYLLLLGAFFPVQTQLGGVISLGTALLLAIYVCSLLSALVVGFFLRRFVLPGQSPSLLLELPPYRRPRLAHVLREVWDRVVDFTKSAGSVILCFSVLLWALLRFPEPPTSAKGPAHADHSAIEHSYGGRFGKMIEPVLEPIGQDWRVGIGIVGSFAAREVLISTLGLVYDIEDADASPQRLSDKLTQAKDERTGKPRYSPASAMALLVFFIYSAQCMSTLAVLRRETNSWRWPVFSFVSMTVIAYLGAWITYRLLPILYP